MNVITTLKEKREEKQMNFEKTLLRELSIKQLKKRVYNYFGSSRFTTGLLMNSGIEEACFDVGIEAYLLGGHFSRFGYFGESIEEIMKRCEYELKHLTETFYYFFLYWSKGIEGVVDEGLYYLCEQYIESWWREGFQKGERQYKLRLH
ncbi:YbaK family protein [Bacillus aquiflavi]|uniref:YbaK family protein n=1 Tax=Bacillus aquiflavi TaxID=2672567 RepID=A0A6B3W578_9BACI|nr:YbaK family protein [Bacillus aquiflavi]MBA4538716.1 YbaK family protein [Bacillus aquiflavi]NEY83076.1 YbaK family protein [Bacillus aquiflavi]